MGNRLEGVPLPPEMARLRERKDLPRLYPPPSRYLQWHAFRTYRFVETAVNGIHTAGRPERISRIEQPIDQPVARLGCCGAQLCARVGRFHELEVSFSAPLEWFALYRRRQRRERVSRPTQTG